MAASLPPVIITSAMSFWISLKASPMALVAEAQAVATAVFGPRRPKWIETLPLAALTISLGIMNGLTRVGPAVEQLAVLLFDLVQAADAAADEHAAAERVALREVDARLP